jgi:8-oxo-dGTP pyrophosphatase MutT (NUDIX family)
MEKHFTVTAYVIQEKKVLLLLHPKYQKWLPPGGHLEPGETPPEGVIREVKEETGLDIELIVQENLWIDCWNASSFNRPYLCLLENIPEIGSKPAHQHMDLIYLARPIEEKAVEQDHLKWFSLEEIDSLLTDQDIFGETQQTLRHLLSTL